MVRLERLSSEHFRELYLISKEVESRDISFEEFKMIMGSREGYTLVDDSGEIAGCVSFSNYVPDVDVMVHIFVSKKFQKRWVSRAVLREIARYVFDYLSLMRLSAFVIADGGNNYRERFLEKLGFKKEGYLRKAYKRHDRYFDIKLYGMLREDCKWLKR